MAPITSNIRSAPASMNRLGILRQRAVAHFGVRVMDRLSQCLVLLAAITAIAARADEHITGCWPTTTADAAPFSPPTFEQFRTDESFNGTTARPDVHNQRRARRYRTMIEDGAKQGPNFAGHYTIVGWGCGAACTDIAIVDSNTGSVTFPAFRELVHYGFDVAPGEPGPMYWPLRFRRDSSLLIVIGIVEENGRYTSGIRYYNWNGRQLIPLKQIYTDKVDCEPR